LIQSTHSSQPPLEQDPHIRMVVLFDNEEVGSVSAAGADSNLLLASLRRLAETKLADDKNDSERVSVMLLDE
jgi:aspartyl aminopeptidase